LGYLTRIQLQLVKKTAYLFEHYLLEVILTLTCKNLILIWFRRKPIQLVLLFSYTIGTCNEQKGPMHPNKITITKPDDWHLHLRDKLALSTTVPHSARAFGRALVMPNLTPPIITVDEAISYRERIIAEVPKNSNFQPLMTLYLTDNTELKELSKIKDSEHVLGVKYYPAGATTNSSNGVTSIEKVYHLIEEMSHLDIPLLFHGEVTDHHVDIFDREKVFIETILSPLTERYPDLRIVLEHITTKNAVDFVKDQSKNVAATITIHHLLYNRNDMFLGGLRPHFYCLPVLKRDIHQKALIKASLSGNPKFFLGTDSAPHTQSKKESSCGCAGIYSAPAALELYFEFFENNDGLDKLEGFASFFGADFYQLPRSKKTITLKKNKWRIPKEISFQGETIIPMHADQEVQWQITEN